MIYDGNFINELIDEVTAVIGKLSPLERAQMKNVMDRAYNRGALDGSVETLHAMTESMAEPGDIRRSQGISDFALMEHIHGRGNVNG